jgi:hypothetical protein
LSVHRSGHTENATGQEGCMDIQGQAAIETGGAWQEAAAAGRMKAIP